VYVDIKVAGEKSSVANVEEAGVDTDGFSSETSLF